MNIAIVGGSGAVGQELLKILEQRNFPFDDLKLFGSERSVGKEYNCKGKPYKVQLLKHGDDFKGINFAFVSAGSDVSKEFADDITRFGCIMIDNSSAFRMDENVPLVVPEVNALDAKFCPRRIVANPNCTTIQMVVALKAIDDISHIKRIYVSTYQAASGAGAAAMDELREQCWDYILGEEVIVKKFPHQLAFNMIPQVDVFTDNGYTKEEMKLVYETHKILNDESIAITPTAVRVPVLRSHAESIHIELEEKISADEAREILNQADRIIVSDDPENKVYPMPVDTANHDDIFVGRIRNDLYNDKALNLWVCFDQIRKGAATNTVQIAELLIENNWLQHK